MTFKPPKTKDRDVTLSLWLREGTNFHKNNQFDQAEIYYQSILKAQPNNIGAIQLMSILRRQQSRYDEAVKFLKQVVKLNPKSFAAHSDLGIVYEKLGQLDLALLSYDRAIDLNPGLADALTNRGNVLFALGRSEDALLSYNAAVVLQPNLSLAHYNRGIALAALKRPMEAIASYDRALELTPTLVGALNNRGTALEAIGRLDEALQSYDKSIAIEPCLADAHYNRGSVLSKMLRAEESLKSYDIAIAIQPDNPLAHNNRAQVLCDLKRFDEALEIYDNAPALKIEFPIAQYNRSLILLLKGELAEGWNAYEYRFEQDHIAKRNRDYHYPVWRGEQVDGKRILIYDEQGLGDVIQFARFLPLLADKGADVTFVVSSKLLRLLTPLGQNVRLADSECGGGYDFQCALLSLMAKLNITLENIPALDSYLIPEPELAAHWRGRLGADGFKVGIAWQGNPDGKIDAGRSIPVNAFEPLARIPGVRLVSLQKNHGIDQLNMLPSTMTVELLGNDFDSGLDAFIDTAAVMANLDLIVTSDTSIAHLAGALGRPVWVALKHVPDWRWLLDRSNSPWYPSMRLYRQAERGNWPTVFNQIATDLRALLASNE